MFGERISLFPHVHSSEAMAPPPPSFCKDCGLRPDLQPTGPSQYTNSAPSGRGAEPAWRIQTGLSVIPEQTVFQWSFLSSSSIWTVSTPEVVWSDTQPDTRVKPETICFGVSYHSISQKPCLSLFLRFVLLCRSCQELKGMTLHTVTHSSCWGTSLCET